MVTRTQSTGRRPLPAPSRPVWAARRRLTLGRLGLGLGRDCSDSDSATGRTRRGLSDQRSEATECETQLAVSRPSLLSVLSMYKLTG